jgi:putative transcriptional regulator
VICKLASLIDAYNLKAADSSNRPQRLTQKRLVEETKIAGSTISRLYKNEFTRVDTQTIQKLCDYFGCEIEDFLVLKEDEATP